LIALVRVIVNRSPSVSFSDPSALGVTTGSSDAPFMQIVLNWFEELNRLAPATR